MKGGTNIKATTLLLAVSLFCSQTAIGKPPHLAWSGMTPDEAKAVQAAAARKLGIPVRAANNLAMEFVLIPSGTFIMGSDDGDIDQRPAHQVQITKPFYLQTTEVTQAQWKSVMGDNPSGFTGDKMRPVEQVSFLDAMEFIRKLNAKDPSAGYRLPTEAEWEYACRAGSNARYWFGDDEGRLGAYAWCQKNSDLQTHPVAGKLPNPWGLYDMHGNVSEWCRDWFGHDYYAHSPAKGPSGPAYGSGRIFRGGDYYSPPQYHGAAFRNWLHPAGRAVTIGIRLVREH